MNVNARVLPATLMTADTWTDTGGVLGTASRPLWCSNHQGNSAIRKPGRIVAGSLEAVREVLASQLGGWMGINVPVVELLPVPPDGPCCISRAIVGAVIPYGHAIRAPMTPATTRSAAIAALPAFGGAIVLDALVGNCDRLNDGNIVYAAASQRWFSLDYSFSFNLYQPTGVGDPAKAFGSDPALRQVYFPEIIEGIRTNPTALTDAITAAEAISDSDIDGLVALVPASHSKAEEAGKMSIFIKERRSAIRVIMTRWANSAKLVGII